MMPFNSEEIPQCPFTIYEDPAERIVGLDIPEGSVNDLTTPHFEDAADELSRAIRAIALSETIPVAWATEHRAVKCVERNAKTFCFGIAAGNLQCCCYFVPSSSDIVLKNEGGTSILITGGSASFVLKQKCESPRLPPGIWYLARQSESPTAALRTMSAVDSLQEPAEVAQPIKRLRFDRDISVHSNRLNNKTQMPLSRRRERSEPPLTAKQKDQVLAGICYRVKRHRVYGKTVTMTLCPVEWQPTSLALRAQMWNSCAATLPKFYHPHILKLLSSDARNLSVTAMLSAPALLVQTDADGYFVGKGNEMLEQIASALVYVHGKGFTNCDLGPRTILRQRDRYVLSGFWRSESHNIAFEATPWYLPPEFFQRDSTRDQKSDVFAWGIVALYAHRYIPLPDRRPWWDAVGIRQGTDYHDDIRHYVAWGDEWKGGVRRLQTSGRKHMLAALQDHEARPTAVELYGKLLHDAGEAAAEQQLSKALSLSCSSNHPSSMLPQSGF